MTEAEWNACTDPQPMLEFLRGKASERKLRLVAVACCRRIWHLLADERSQRAVEMAEQFADGLSSRPDLTVACAAAEQPCVDAINRADGWDDHAMAAIAAENTASTSTGFLTRVLYHTAVLGDHHETSIQAVRNQNQSCLLRDIFGNPFHPVTIDPHHLTASVTSLAQAIYDERAFDRLQILADALEDAGCHDAAILEHCRGGGEHVRGCWVVDLLTGKE